eukprot:jgi/Botrbrau1/12964/Bobra.154_2s0019.1
MQVEALVTDNDTDGSLDQRVVALVNAYLVQTTELINKYAASSEVELLRIHERISAMDATLRLLEAQILGAETTQASDIVDDSTLRTQVEVTESSAASTVGDSVEEIDLRSEDLAGPLVPQSHQEARVVDQTTAFVEMLRATALSGTSSGATT